MANFGVAPVSNHPRWRPLGRQGQQPQQQMVQAVPYSLEYSPRMGQIGGPIGPGLDALFGILTGASAIIGGLAAAILVGANRNRPRPAWKWVGGLTAGLGGVLLVTQILAVNQLGGPAIAPPAPPPPPPQAATPPTPPTPPSASVPPVPVPTGPGA